MTSAELLKAGQVDGALSELQAEIRRNPEDGRLRVYLFQLNCILGRWNKALDQLQTLATLDAETMLLAQIFRPILGCELLRSEVFAGNRTPLLLGEGEGWLAELIQANVHLARGEFEAAAKLRDHAFEESPGSSGRINGSEFAWMADADSRLGPVLEVILEGNYYWVPITRIRRIEMSKPEDLRDLVWAPAQFVWSNGGTASGHVPVRYPGTENDPDEGLRLARGTKWEERPAETFLGRGQRIFNTDVSEYPILECRLIEFNEG